jgi:hypothetical protein
LKKGGPGRPKGVPNKKTVEAKTFCAGIVTDPIYQLRVRERALKGELPPALEAMLWAYCFGKPKDETHVQGDIVLRWEGEADQWDK